ncbi:MAG: hypothetical protein IPK16_09585 [Anaerolineales bacterium]|nr:hypothetical protein [Anaerolineales bacterium]
MTPIPQQASITVSNPTANSSLPATFQVSGVATGPNGATIAVQAQNNSSGVLAGTTTTLQTTSGSFGSGSWSVSLTVNQVVAGRIVAALVGQPIGPANVPVTFNGGSSQQLVITQPTPNAQLAANFIVSGSGSSLPATR